MQVVFIWLALELLGSHQPCGRLLRGSTFLNLFMPAAVVRGPTLPYLRAPQPYDAACRNGADLSLVAQPQSGHVSPRRVFSILIWAGVYVCFVLVRRGLMQTNSI